MATTVVQTTPFSARGARAKLSCCSAALPLLSQPGEPIMGRPKTHCLVEGETPCPGVGAYVALLQKEQPTRAGQRPVAADGAWQREHIEHHRCNAAWTGQGPGRVVAVALAADVIVEPATRRRPRCSHRTQASWPTLCLVSAAVCSADWNADGGAPCPVSAAVCSVDWKTPRGYADGGASAESPGSPVDVQAESSN